MDSGIATVIGAISGGVLVFTSQWIANKNDTTINLREQKFTVYDEYLRGIQDFAKTANRYVELNKKSEEVKALKEKVENMNRRSDAYWVELSQTSPEQFEKSMKTMDDLDQSKDKEVRPSELVRKMIAKHTGLKHPLIEEAKEAVEQQIKDILKLEKDKEQLLSDWQSLSDQMNISGDLLIRSGSRMQLLAPKYVTNFTSPINDTISLLMESTGTKSTSSDVSKKIDEFIAAARADIYSPLRPTILSRFKRKQIERAKSD